MDAWDKASRGHRRRPPLGFMSPRVLTKIVSRAAAKLNDLPRSGRGTARTYAAVKRKIKKIADTEAGTFMTISANFSFAFVEGQRWTHRR